MAWESHHHYPRPTCCGKINNGSTKRGADSLFAYLLINRLSLEKSSSTAGKVARSSAWVVEVLPTVHSVMFMYWQSTGNVFFMQIGVYARLLTPREPLRWCRGITGVFCHLTRFLPFFHHKVILYYHRRPSIPE